MGTFEMFDHPDDVLRYGSCARCGERVNRWGHAEKLDKPDVYGAGSSTPTTFTHRNTVSCKNGCTSLRILGYMTEYVANGCLLRSVARPLIGREKP